MKWAEANQRYLAAAFAVLADDLGGTAEGGDADRHRRALDAAAAELAGTAAIDRVAAQFSLSSFERATLLLLAGVELDPGVAAACAARGDGSGYPTFALALDALPDAHWSAVSPAGPLRYWKLLEVGPGDTLTTARLRIDERILHHLAGIDALDERLDGYVREVPGVRDADPAGGWSTLPRSHHAAVERLLQVWRATADGDGTAVVQLTGPDPRTMARITATAAGRVGMRVHRLADDDIPAAPAQRSELARLWEREAILGGRVLIVAHGDGEARGRAAQLADLLRTPCVLAGRDPLELAHRTTIPLRVERPTRTEQRALWSAAIPQQVRAPEPDLDDVVRQFDLGPDVIREAGLDFAALAAAGGRAGLWDVARTHARPRGATLAHRIDARASWADLVLPDKHLATLRQIAAQVRHRTTVYDDWGFAEHQARGLGISALFVGRSGTGKTLAAEVLANELALDLYRIDLSAVVSKYIGETEKHLRRVFDDAESGGAILLFDEADALFGKRSEVRDSHDRYANIEVSYLLQRMEAYRGLAILTTNMKDALDPAFFRRIRFVVEFRHPDRILRERIWAGAFPNGTPVDSIEPAALAELELTGGNIRNVAMNAAFLAADDGAAVTMAHLGRAVRDEFDKLDRPLSAEVVRAWS